MHTLLSSFILIFQSFTEMNSKSHLKVIMIKSASHLPASAHPGRSNLIALLDNFYHHGPHGTHVCMVFEPAGENLLDMIRQYYRHSYRGIPVQVVREIGKQVLLGLDYIHRVCGLIHTGNNFNTTPFKPSCLSRHQTRRHSLLLSVRRLPPRAYTC